MIDANYLRERLDYDPHTGILTWKFYNYAVGNNERWAGREAGRLHEDGYREIGLDYKLYPAHRLAWVIHYGEIDDRLMVDHINCRRSDNRISNLRLATNSQNLHNGKLKKNNTSGYKNVSQRKDGRWSVEIHVNKRRYRFHSFATAEEANEVAARERTRLHGEFARAA